MEEVKRVISQIQKKEFSPIYFLMGEETYYINKISQLLIDSVLTEAEKDFNQIICYGQDIQVSEIITHCKRYPVFGDKQLVVVKEAQSLRNIGELENYAQQTVSSTILVICYKNKKLDKKKKLYKTLSKQGYLLESKRLYENQVPTWLKSVLKTNGYQITPQAQNLLIGNIGTDLTQLSKSIDKLKYVLERGTTITEDHISTFIGIHKTYNNFELRKAIGKKDRNKALQITYGFAQNPKQHPVVVTLSLLFRFFSDILLLHSKTGLSKNQKAQLIGINPYFIDEYQTAQKNYNMKHCSYNLSCLKKADAQAKGIFGTISELDILRELISKIII